MKHLLTRGILAGILAFAFTCPLRAQYIDFSFNGCELAFQNTLQTSATFSFALKGFVFKEDLLYDDQYAYPQTATLSNFLDAAGYNAPYRAGQGSAGGDITTYEGTVGAGEFTVTVNNTWSFILNLIDANFGAGNTYRVLFVWDGSYLTAFVASPNATDPMRCEQSITIQPNDYVHLRDLIRGATGGGTAFTTYKRDRGSLATRLFELGGGDLPRYGIDNARLDVNCRMTADVYVSSTNDKTLDIEGFADNLYSSELTTTWYFDDGTGLDVYGRIHAGTLVDNSRINFTSSSASPTPGLWDGVVIQSNLASDGDHFYVTYARTALAIIDNHTTSTFTTCTFSQNLYHGVLVSNSYPRFFGVTASNSNSDGVKVQGPEAAPWFKNGSIVGNGGNGVSIDDNAYAYLGQLLVTSNDLHGVAVFSNSWPYIDSCQIFSNGESGIYSYDNGYKWTTVRHSRIGTNNWWGLHNVSNGYLRAYYAPPGMTDPEDLAVQPDSLGLNCVHDNVIENLFGDQNSIFEMARVYEAPDQGGTMVAHFQGRDNSIVYANPGQYQGTMDGGSEAWVIQDWWNNNYAFNLPNGSAYTFPRLSANPVSGCGEELGPSGIGGSVAAGTASPYDSRAWWQRAGDPPSMKQYLQTQLATLGAGDLDYGLFMLGRRVDSLQMDVFCRTLLGATKDADKRAAALAHLGKSLMSQRRYADAVAVYDEIAALSPAKVNSRHTSAQGMAALMESYAGDKTAGLARLDTALAVFPADRQLLAAWHLLGGGARVGTPKRAATDGLPAGYMLDESYPNPFSESTMIRFTLPETAALRITVYDALGHALAVPVDDVYEAGPHGVEWNAAGLAPGMYFITMRVGAHETTRTVILAR
ncbi:MAG: T9SS type A sorting domain-containing protein [Ignavibacteriae bacterium]|nr:T9SS type A sorting domain-containing protein [Ignavibacteriota bacterium]